MPASRVTVPPLPQLPAAEVLSFLKETRGVLTWTAADLAKSLRISKQDDSYGPRAAVLLVTPFNKKREIKQRFQHSDIGEMW
jgi:hypothetical protein